MNDSTHPLFRRTTELVWEGKYDLGGNRVAASAEDCEGALVELERIDRPRPEAASNRQRSLLANDHGPLGDFVNRLVWGDNGLVLSRLREEFGGTVDLIYIDPPFNVGTDFFMDAQPGGASGDPVSGRGMLAYRDSWGQDGGAYLQMMYERLVLLRDLMSQRGSIYVHCDYRASHYLRVMLDEVFGAPNFRNELIWCYRGGGVPRNDFAAKHDTIFRYSKSDTYLFNADEVRIPYSPDVQASPASRYDKSYRSNKVYEGYRPHALGKHPEDWWPIQPIMPSDRTERLDYPTQKPVELVQRIVDASSLPGSLVLDAFCGSGTTLAVAEGLRVKREISRGKARLRYYHVAPRRWIGVDIGRFAIHTSRKRLIELQRARQAQGAAYRSFGVYGLGAGQGRRGQRNSLPGDESVYRRTVLEAFGANPLDDQERKRPGVDGNKEGIACHVIGREAVCTRGMAEDLIRALAAQGIDRCYCLAWEFAVNLPADIAEWEQKHEVQLRLVQIPREIADEVGNRLPWFQAGRLEVQLVYSAAAQGKAVDVQLERFVREPADTAFEKVDSRGSSPDNGTDLIDFWAIDFDWRPDRPFHQYWQEYRSRKDPRIAMVSSARFVPQGPGSHVIAVKVIDRFGYETVATVGAAPTGRAEH